MRKISDASLPMVIALVASVALAGATPSPAQVRRGSLGPPATPPADSPYFDPATTMTLSGELVSGSHDWEMWGHGNFTGGGVHFQLATDGGDVYELMLGPQWFLAELGTTLHEGDRVTVTGSVVEAYGEQPWMGGPHGPGAPGTAPAEGPTSVGAGHGGHGGEPGAGHHGGGPGPGPGTVPEGTEDFFVVTRLEVAGLTLELRDPQGYPLWRGGPTGGVSPFFDPSTVAELRGTLSESLGFWNPWGHGNHTGGGMQYELTAEGGEVFYAMLGPWWYLDQQGVSLEAGEELVITGSIVDPYWDGLSEHRFLIATEIRIGAVRVPLRDDGGFPLWRGPGLHPYYAPDYDPAAEHTVSGVVVRTRSTSYGGHRDPGYEVSFLPGNGPEDPEGAGRFLLFVAPRWYVDQVGFGLRTGERIELRGAAVQDFLGRPTLVVRWVQVDGERWSFRDAQGHPLWVRGAP